MPITTSSNSTYIDGKIVPPSDAIYDLCRDSLENLRLMRQLESFPKERQAKIVVEGYELFERWASLHGFSYCEEE